MTLTCTLCGPQSKVFYSDGAFQQHFSDKHPETYECDVCEKMFGSGEALSQHSAAKHPEIYACESCNKKFCTERACEQHSAAVHPPRFRCEICGVAKFKSVGAAEQHIADSHPERHTCSLCPRSFKSQSGLQQHKADYHPVRFGCNFCPQAFGSDEARNQHTEVKHPAPHACNLCTARFQTSSGLINHHATTHVRRCTQCNKAFSSIDALAQHVADVHRTCPQCSQVFHGTRPHSATRQLYLHQKAMAHCYCSEHDVACDSRADYRTHMLTIIHTTGFECIECDQAFRSEQALNQHMRDKVHTTRHLASDQSDRVAAAPAAAEQANLRCEACDRDFVHLTAFLQHKDSVKHNPLSDLTCPMSGDCDKTFTSPSALLFHLESGACKSGMTRIKLNKIVQTHDTGYAITQAGSAPLTKHSKDAAEDEILLFSRLRLEDWIADSIDSEPEDTSDTESDYSGWDIGQDSILRTSRPPASTLREHLSSQQVVSRDWYPSFHPDASSQSDHGTVTVVQPASPQSCNVCGRTFRKEAHLLNHLESAVHAPKIFHCPTSLLDLMGSKHGMAFKTLSGLAQHIEAGVCSGGRETLKTIVGLFEDKMRAATGQDVKLLKNSAEDWR